MQTEAATQSWWMLKQDITRDEALSDSICISTSHVQHSHTPLSSPRQGLLWPDHGVPNENHLSRTLSTKVEPVAVP